MPDDPAPVVDCYRKRRPRAGKDLTLRPAGNRAELARRLAELGSRRFLLLSQRRGKSWVLEGLLHSLLALDVGAISWVLRLFTLYVSDISGISVYILHRK
jgi:hypothetical protein